MKTAALLICLIIVGFSCAPTQKLNDEYPDAIEINPPDQVPYIEKNITIHSVQPIQVGRQYGLVIEGDFPNVCTQILRINERAALGKLDLKVLGWQRYQKACAETITPFTHIYEIPRDLFQTLDTVSVNGTIIELTEIDN